MKAQPAAFPDSHALTFSVLAGAPVVQQLLITAHGSCQIIVAVALAPSSCFLLFSLQDVICAKFNAMSTDNNQQCCICGVVLPAEPVAEMRVQPLSLRQLCQLRAGARRSAL